MNFCYNFTRRSLTCFSLHLVLALVASFASGNASAQQSPKRNAEVLVTFDVCAPDVAYQPSFPGNLTGTLNFYCWDNDNGESKFNQTWNGPNGGVAGQVTHSGPKHMMLKPNRTYAATVTHIDAPNTWGEVKISAPPGYAVVFGGVPRESFRAIAAELTNNIFSFSIREVGDGGLLPAGYSLSPDLAPFVWTVSTGTFANGISISPIQLRATALSQGMLSPTALNFVNPYSPEVAVTAHSDGGIIEVDTFQAILHIRRGSPSGGYTIEVYSPYATRTGSGDGPYTYNEKPLREFRVSNPDGQTWNNRIQIEKIEREGSGIVRTETWLVVQDGTTWTITETSGLRVITRTSVQNGSNREETVEIKNNNNVVATRVKRVYQSFPWGQEELVQEIANPGATDGTQLTTSYAYHTSPGTGGYGRLQSVTAPDGSWVRYNYDDTNSGIGNLAETLRPWQGAPASPANATNSNCSVTSFSYSAERAIFSDTPSGSISKVNGTIVGQSVVATTFPSAAPNGQPLRRETINKYTATGAYLTTVVETYNATTASAEFRGRPYSQVNPDGTQTSFLRYKAYFWNYGDSNSTNLHKTPGNPGADNTWGEYSFQGFNAQVTGSVRVDNWDGESFAPIYMVPNRSTVDLVIYNAEGRPWFNTRYVFTGASGGTPTFEFLSQSEVTYDNGLPAVQRALNGFREQRAFIGDQLSGIMSNDGSYTEITRDALGRETLACKFGIGATGEFPAQGAIYTHKTFDAASRVLTTKTSASANSTDPGILVSRTYSLSGLLQNETDASGLTTSYTYSNGARTVTSTTPSGTRIEDRHPLGTFVSGTMVVPQFSRVVVNGDGSMTTETYSLSVANAAAVSGALAANSTSSLATALAASPRWTKVTTDWTGRTKKTEQPAPPGANPGTLIRQHYYNGIGQLEKTTESGLADTLIVYNAWKLPYRSGLDLSSPGDTSTLTPNGQLDLASQDRITETDAVFEKDGNGAWWSKTTTKTYNENGSATAITVATSKIRLNKYSGYVQAESSVTDTDGNTTTKMLIVQRGSTESSNDIRLVTESVDYSDSSADELSISRNGLLQKRQSKEGLIYRSYYDDLARLVKTTDPRTDPNPTPVRIGYYDASAAAGSRHKVAWSEDAAGNRTKFGYYSTTGRLYWTQDPAGKLVRNDYTDRGELMNQWGAATYPVVYGYTDYGERKTMNTYRNGSDWDSASWPTSTTGAADTTTWNYDAATGVLLSKTVPAADPASSDPVRKAPQTVSYTYNTRGQIKSRTSARNIVTNYSYYGEQAGEAKTGELRLIDYPNGSGTTDISYTYSRQGLASQISDATGTRMLAYRDNGVMRSELLDSAFFGGRTLTYKFDTAAGVVGRVQGYTIAQGASVEQDLTYGFDTYGRQNAVTTSGVTATYAYTPNSNLLASVTDTASGWTQVRTYEASRDVLDVIETKVGVATKAKFDYTVNELGQRTDVSKTGELFARYGATGLGTHWDYTDRGEVKYEQARLGGTQTGIYGRTLEFDYDNLGNRKTAKIDSRTLTYASNAVNQYDSVAGRTFVDVTGFAPATATVSVNGTAVPSGGRQGDYFFSALYPSLPAWQAATVSSTAGGTDVSRKLFLPTNPEPLLYDADGNMKSDGRWTYYFDAENRLAAMETRSVLMPSPFPNADARRLEFTYDYLGRRVRKTVRGGYNGTSYTTVILDEKFIYEGWNLTSVRDASTMSIKTSFIWGLDWSGTRQGAGGVGGLLMVVDQTGASSVYLQPAYDGNGNVMGLMSRSTGGIVASYEYDAFGNILRAEGVAAAINPFRFSTKYTDSESGLIYYGLRYYSPSLGRFVCRDPKEEMGGINLYAFIRNNAVNGYDYLGMDGIGFLTCGWSSFTAFQEMFANFEVAAQQRALDAVAAAVQTEGKDRSSQASTIAGTYFYGTSGSSIQSSTSTGNEPTQAAIPGLVYGQVGADGQPHAIDLQPFVVRANRSDTGDSTYTRIHRSVESLNAGRYHVLTDGSRVQIVTNIEYSGPGATPDVAAKFSAGIEKAWTGKFGKYTVKTFVNVTDKGKRFDPVIFNAHGSITPNMNGRGMWDSFMSGWDAGHEMGHGFGLGDRYDTRTRKPDPGYEDNIMGGVPGTRPSEDDITRIIDIARGADQQTEQK